ncbi:MAG: DUF4286 family protein [Bacteroidota bacterium]|nr:DUF4286 family protein [Bacteroidota bacterium]
MLIVNTTFHVAESCEEAWKKWVREAYIPEVVKTNLLINPTLFHLLVENEPGTNSYALQFEVADLSTLQEWFDNYGVTMQQSMSKRFNEDVLGFTTLMERLETVDTQSL